MTTLREAAQQAKQVPLRELLASVPADARLVIDDADGKGTRFIPVGRLCQEAAAALAEPTLQTCNCRWDGEMQMQQCTLHEAHVDAIKEWAQRAKFAEKKLAALAESVQEPVAWVRQSELDDLLTCNHRRLGADSPRIWAPFDISSPSPDMGLVAVYAAPPQRKPLVDPAEYDDAGAAERYNRGLK